MNYLIIGVFWTLSLYLSVGESFNQGYEQGYAEGKERALMSPGSMETCSRWWFDGNASRARQAMDQYCERNKK